MRVFDSFQRQRVSGCLEIAAAGASSGFKRNAYATPTLNDYPIILRGSKGPLVERTPAALYALACREGWPDTCGRAGDAGGQ